MTELSPGMQFAERYRILEEIGRGGMGVVYRAEDVRLKRTVALKFLSPNRLQDIEEHARFLREARAAAVLDHPSICTVYEVDEVEDRIFISMADIKGRPLKDLIREHPLGIDEILKLAIQMVDGLREAHEMGVIHRDISCRNVLVTDRGQAKIMDFGLAKRSGDSSITEVGTTLGTLSYMSPEQARAEEVDERSDLWSMGVVLYEMLTGQVPYSKDTEAATIYSILSDPVSPPTGLRSDTPSALERIVLRCLRKSADERYQSALHLLSDLVSLQAVLRDRDREGQIQPKGVSRPSRETERRLTTVVIAEIASYQEMLTQLGDEQIAAATNDCFALFNTTVSSYGGWAERAGGGRFMAFFGAPAAVEDSPRKAVNASIEFRNRVDRFNFETRLGFSVNTRLGIQTGMVIVDIARAAESKNYTFTGRPIDIATSLMEMAGIGQVYVGPETYRHTADEFSFADLKPQLVKGSREPVPVFDLLSRIVQLYRPSVGFGRAVFSEMVGREREIDLLHLHVLKVINGDGSIVNVVGEAGIGKTRLIAELADSGPVQKVLMLKGRSLSIGTNLSYHPLVDMLRNWSGIEEEDTGVRASFRLEQAVTSVAPDEVSEIVPFVGTLMGLRLPAKHQARIEGIEGEALENLIRKNLRDLLISIARSQPLVVILEDMHWADLSSLDFLESLYRLVQHHPILFINVMRPNFPQTGERIRQLAREEFGDLTAEILLGPLDEMQSRRLIDNLLQAEGLPSRVASAITDRTEGNPYFIEEVVRSLIDDGILESRDGQLRVAERIEAVEIPETIQDVLMARLDRLEEQTRSLLKVASVIGRSFFYRILSQVARSIEDIDDRLNQLLDTELIRERSRLAELEYLFSHALAHETTYESILHSQRKELHLKIARTVESIFMDRLHEFFGVLALHYSEGEDLEKAEEYLIKAGEEAMKAAASTEALAYYEDALRLYRQKHGEAADPAKLGVLESNIAVALYNKARMIEAVERFDRALAYLGERRPRARAGVIVKLVADMVNVLRNLYLPSRLAKAQPKPDMNRIVDLYYKRATAMSSVDNQRFFIDSVGLLRELNKVDVSKVKNGPQMYIHASNLFCFSGVSHKIGRKLLDYSRPKLQKDDPGAAADYAFAELVHGIISGNWGDDIGISASTVAYDLERGELWDATTYAFWCHILHTEQGQFDHANACLETLKEISELYDSEFARSRYYLGSLRLWLKQRRITEFSSELATGRTFVDEVGQNLYSLHVTSLTASLRVLEGDLAAASDLLEVAAAHAAKEGRIVPYHRSTYAMARVAYACRRLEQAVREGDRAAVKMAGRQSLEHARFAVSTSMKFPAIQTDAFRHMGTHHWLVGKPGKAALWWRRSIETGERLGALPELARTYAEVVRVLHDSKVPVRKPIGFDLDTAARRAAELFEALDLKWDLEMLRQSSS